MIFINVLIIHFGIYFLFFKIKNQNKKISFKYNKFSKKYFLKKLINFFGHSLMKEIYKYCKMYTILFIYIYSF